MGYAYSMKQKNSKAPTVPKSCPHCEKTFLAPKRLSEHIKAKHEKNTPFKCGECHRSYGSSKTLRDHKKAMHERVKCEICSQEICNEFILRRHKASVHGILPPDALKCKHCSAFYVSQKMMENHVLKNHPESEEARKVDSKTL